MRWLILVVLFPLGCAPLGAQAVPALGADGRVGGTVGGGAGFTTVKGSWVPVVRGSAGLQLLPWLRVGGEAALPLDGVRLSPEGSPDRSELRLGYGGLRFDLSRPSAEGSDPWGATLLVGAGTARVRAPPSDADLGSQNFFLVEPAIRRGLVSRGPLRLSASAGVRMAGGGSTLPGVRTRDIRGVSLTLTAELFRSP